MYILTLLASKYQFHFKNPDFLEPATFCCTPNPRNPMRMMEMLPGDIAATLQGLLLATLGTT